MYQLGDYVSQCDNPLGVPFVIDDIDPVDLFRVQPQYDVLDGIVLFTRDDIMQQGRGLMLFLKMVSDLGKEILGCDCPVLHSTVQRGCTLAILAAMV